MSLNKKPKSIPAGWRLLNPGEYPKPGDKEWRLKRNMIGFSWQILGKSDELFHPIEEHETIIRKV